MKINNIALENFRQFYGLVSIDVTTTNDRNIILIGGKNGHGKTNFLLSIVWCLYGELINQVDDSFKAEIANNYSKFLDGVLNKDKKIEGGTTFSVELLFGGVVYDDHEPATISIKRSYDIDSQNESLEIIPDKEFLLALETKEEKQSFINDYLIPIEIARFVFFDAEKISQIADLSPAKQAKLMDKTLGNMLGLNIYLNLLDEIIAYIRSLKRASSTQETLEQILSFENSIKSNQQSLEAKNIDLQGKIKRIKEITTEIEQLEIRINRKGGDNTDIRELQQQRETLKQQRDEVKIKFYNIADVIPLWMLSGLMQEAKEHIGIEADNRQNETAKASFSEKVDSFIDELFNKGEFPDPDIKFKQKEFYAKKSETLAKCFIDDDGAEYKLPFSHNLDSSKIKNLADKYADIQIRSNTKFISTITTFSKKKAEYEALDRRIKKIEVTSADDLTKSLIDDKNKHQYNKDSLNKNIGRIESDISKLETDNSTNEKRLSRLYGQSKVNTINQEKIKLTEKYISVLKDFIQIEKEEKKESIKNKLLEELNNLWHKQLVKDARLTLLPNDKGMEVELLDGNDSLIDSEKLSKGEQQLYVSALLKSILDNSIHDLPVFIDTPLARLDSTHRDNILQHYYPNLSNQVVVFSTDTEITTSKYDDIKQCIVKSYLITNVDGKSGIKEGYFN